MVVRSKKFVILSLLTGVLAFAYASLPQDEWSEFGRLTALGVVVLCLATMSLVASLKR